MSTILVIDDHLLTIQTLCLILGAQGHIALAAENAEQARQSFAFHEVDIVIVDYVLPDGTGSEIADEFKRVKSVPVIMLSGSAELQEKPASVDVLLAKPCSIPDLLEAIDNLIAREIELLPLSA